MIKDEKEGEYKMKSKTKFKTLGFIVLILFIVLIIVPLGNLGIANYLNQKGSEKAEGFYNNYMASPIKLNEKQGLYGYAESLTRGTEKFKITFSGWGGGERTSPENMEKAMESFERLLLMGEKKDYKDDYSPKAYLKLLDTSIAILDMDKLNYWIDWGRDKGNEEIGYMSKLYQAYYCFVQKDYNSAKQILEDIDGEKLDVKYYQLMGDINLHLGNIEEAKEYYQAPSGDDFWSGVSYSSGYFGGSNTYLGQYEIENYMDKLEGDYKIKGRVSHDGRGLPFVEVYANQDIGVFSTGGEKPDAITDENGEFETLGLKQGVYEIGIGMHPSQLYNRVFLRKDIWSIELNSDMEFDFEFVTPMEINSPKEKLLVKNGEEIHLSWDSVKGADYYKLESLVFSDPKKGVGSSHRVPLIDKNGEEKLKNNSIDFYIENRNRKIASLSFEGEEELVNPIGILGSFIPEVEYPLIVNAYDKENNQIGSNHTLISDYKDMVSIEIEGDLHEGEKLILDKKYEEAISHYQEKLIENPKDQEALFYLIRIYSIGWKKGEKNIPKALQYAELYDKEYSDHKFAFEVISFMNKKEIKENRQLVGEVLEKVTEENRDTMYYIKMANYYLAGEDYVKARENYEKMTEYRYADIIYIDMYLGDYERAIWAIESGDIMFMKMNTMTVIEALNNMDNISKEDKDLFKKLLKNKLDGSLSRDEEQGLYDNTLSSVTSLEVKNILREIGKEEYWGSEYR